MNEYDDIDHVINTMDKILRIVDESCNSERYHTDAEKSTHIFGVFGMIIVHLYNCMNKDIKETHFKHFINHLQEEVFNKNEPVN